MSKARLIPVAALLLATACGSADDSGQGEEAGESTTVPSTAPSSTEPPSTESPSEEPAVTEPAVTEPTAADQAVDEPPPPEIVRTFSDDGDLGLSYASRTDGLAASIRLLDPSEWPAELAGGDNASGVKIFELEPDGARFDEPVRVTRRLDVSAFESMALGPFDVPLVTMLTQDAAGGYGLLDDLTIVRVGPDLYVSGTTTHFSPIIVSNENRMIPWGPGEDLDPPPPSLGDTSIGPDSMLDDLRRVMDAPADEVVVEEWRRLSAEEAYEFLHKRIERQALGEDGDPPELGGYELPLDDGTVIESEPLPPTDAGPSLDEAGYRAERFGTSFPAVPISALPSTSTLLGDDTGSIAITVWSPALVMLETVLLAQPEPEPEPEPASDPAPTTVPSGASPEEIADCLMYVEMYPELVEERPDITVWCEEDTAAARAFISDVIYG